MNKKGPRVTKCLFHPHPDSCKQGMPYIIDKSTVVRLQETRCASSVSTLGELIIKMDAADVGVKLKYYKMERPEGQSFFLQLVSLLTATAKPPCVSMLL